MSRLMGRADLGNPPRCAHCLRSDASRVVPTPVATTGRWFSKRSARWLGTRSASPPLRYSSRTKDVVGRSCLLQPFQPQHARTARVAILSINGNAAPKRWHVGRLDRVASSL